ncbi:NAD(P)H-hydrate dehydratase [Paenibacillus glufosinatiresistens]|uniref:NAD(P)H-hydrate dehydratase n=1 Tax=Paenibacillus glufosinatiresistens TaxID=3070657 RepID=UPI00286DF0E1|nr:NAD(P)H-hydrate dehydratase [Paenibacillus sp. YX.27]
MYPIVTAAEMRELDRAATEELGIPAIVLMENAGRAIAEEIAALSRRCGQGRNPEGGLAVSPGERPSGCFAEGSDAQGRTDADRAAKGGARSGGLTLRTEAAPGPVQPGAEHWIVLVGKGNNGGDGLVAARHLREAGFSVSLLYAAPPESLMGEAAVQRDIAAALGVPAAVYRGGGYDFTGCAGLVDALLGTSSSGAPRGLFAELIAAANASGLPIVAADIPSGLNADTGETHDPCIQAEVTVCLAFLKRGLLQYPGSGAAGRVVLRSIGIPADLALKQGLSVHWLAPAVLERRLGVDPGRHRAADGHKGTYGHVLVAAGSLPMSGAGLLCARAALRAGCGLVTWALPGRVLPSAVLAAPELMLADAGGSDAGEWTAESADRLLELAGTRDVLAVGPGIGRFPGGAQWLRRLWEEADVPLVVDADALNVLAEVSYAGWRRTRPVVLTPHPGEMARLAGIRTAEVQRDRIGLAIRYAAEHGVTLVLKGAHTVIASPDGRAFVNTTGHPGMATGGAGDVLTGMIAGLLAQGLDGIQAAAFAVYLHGQAGERAAGRRHDPSSIVASDLIEAL